MNMLQGADVRPTTVQLNAMTAARATAAQSDGAVDGGQDGPSAGAECAADRGRVAEG